MNDKRRRIEDSWHLDKRVPLTLILAIFIQTAGIFWWGGTISSEVAQNKRDIRAAVELSERVIRLEEKMEITNDLLRDIRDQLRAK